MKDVVTTLLNSVFYRRILLIIVGVVIILLPDTLTALTGAKYSRLIHIIISLLGIFLIFCGITEEKVKNKNNTK